MVKIQPHIHPDIAEAAAALQKIFIPRSIQSEIYSVLSIDHEHINTNSYNHFKGNKEQYRPPFTIKYQSKSRKSAELEMLRLTQEIVEAKAEFKLESKIIDSNTVEIYDRTTGWLSKAHRLLYTLTICNY